MLTIIIMILFSAGNCLAADTLLQSNSTTYLGAFSVPDVGSDPQTTEYSGTALGFNPVGHNGAGSLLINGFNNSGPYIAELSIPTSLYTGTDTSTVASSPYIASFISPNSGNPYFWDISEGHYADVGSNGTNEDSDCSNGWVTGGLYVDSANSAVYSTSYCLYPQPAQLSVMPIFRHGYSPLSQTGTFQGMYGLNIYTNNFPGSVGNTGDLNSGALGSIPSAYQSQLDGKMIVGGNPWGASIIQRMSVGPSVVVFDPANFAAGNTFPASQNAYMAAGYPFPGDHQTLGAWGYTSNAYISMADHYAAVAFPPNSRSVLVIAQHGIGGPGLVCSNMPTSGVGCYGIGTNNCSEVCYSYSNPGGMPNCTAANTTCGGQSLPSGSNCCYDPSIIGSTHQNTSWPYVSRIYAFDVGNSDGTNTTGNNVHDQQGGNYNTLTAVKLGLKNSWDITPYAYWDLPAQFAKFPGTNYAGNSGQNQSYGGGTYNPISGKLYLSVYNGDRPNAPIPVIEVFQITTGSNSDTTPPAAPNGLSVM